MLKNPDKHSPYSIIYMASFVAGFIIGAYSGATVREEYFAPTIEKTNEAFDAFRASEAKFKEAPPKPTDKIQGS